MKCYNWVKSYRIVRESLIGFGSEELVLVNFPHGATRIQDFDYFRDAILGIEKIMGRLFFGVEAPFSWGEKVNFGEFLGGHGD